MLPAGNRRRTHTDHGLRQASARRVRRRAAAASLLSLAVAAATPFLAEHHATRPPRPRGVDAAAVEVTHLSAHVVVYSAPRRSTASAAEGNQVWPPPRAEGGAPATEGPPTPSVSAAATGLPGTSATSVESAPTGPTTRSPTEGTSTEGEAAPAAMLRQVQCPEQMPAGSLCFEATALNGGAASFPSATSLPTLPVVPSPGLPAPCSATAGASEEQPGGAQRHGGRTRMVKHSHSAHKSEHAADTAAVMENGTGSGSAASCGLLGQTPTDVLGGGASTDLSALEGRSGEKIELTGYSFQDNQGGNNATISCPQIHQKAGGTGTYDDPITVASGGKSGSASGDGIKCGDRFYLPSVQRYVIVEDTGNTPNKSMPHLDMWVADDPGSRCMDKMSGTVTAIPNPPRGLPVLAGPIGKGGSCLLPDAKS